jgi:glycerophosphoryl diester phosphodiesterase
MAPWLENTLLYLVDQYFKAVPQKVPGRDELESCKLVSHRGERDNINVFENTFSAFDPVVEQGIWGIELDVRWTKDLVPVVIHDADGQRVFSKPFVIAENSWEECQKALPLVPSLEQLITRYGKKCHLMIELKNEDYPKLARQKDILKSLLSPLEPINDFHIISLEAHLFEYVDFLPKQALLPVSTTNAKAFSELALQSLLGGVTGHYLFMSKALVNAHHTKDQKIGSGFSNSRHVLFREINKGVDWVFSNKALSMHEIIQKQLEK